MPEVVVSRRELLAGATAELEQAGVAEPRREALRLWSELADEPVGQALVRPDEIPPAETALAFRDAVGRRAAGEPLAHVAGRIGFRHLTLRSDRRALIPRPETEGLVDLLLARVRSGRAVDVGTGTGCLALSLALEGGFSQVVGIDRSAEALALAAENRALVGVPVSLLRGDLVTAMRPGSVDALVANPPYLTTAEYAVLDRSVRDWEPAAALVSGSDGLGATFRLLREAWEVIRPGGWIALEIDCTRSTRCAERAVGLGWTEVIVQSDLFGRERYLLARRSPSS